MSVESIFYEIHNWIQLKLLIFYWYIFFVCNVFIQIMGCIYTFLNYVAIKFYEICKWFKVALSVIKQVFYLLSSQC